MWTINSNDVAQAKDRLERRRTEIETRYAEETRSLDAECAVVETLERVAAEFAVRHIADDPELAAAPPPAEADPPGASEPAESREDVADAPPPAAEADPAGDDEASGPFDILKPGSRWRLNRASRLLNPDGTPNSPSPTSW
jgi:hypothetical protein